MPMSYLVASYKDFKRERKLGSILLMRERRT